MSSDATSAKLALVTGSGQGIGAATLQRLLREGYRVIALDKATAAAANGAIINCEFDLVQTHEIGPLGKRLVAAHGPITALVNNAGIWPGGPIYGNERRDLAAGVGGDSPVVAGESGCAATAALISACGDDALRKTLGLDKGSRVLVIGSEGATDAEIYRQVVGQTPEQVAEAI